MWYLNIISKFFKMGLIWIKLWSKWDPCVSIVIVISDKTCSQMIFRLYKKVLWLFHHLLMFYHSKHIKSCPNRSWHYTHYDVQAKSIYYIDDQNEIHMCQLWLPYEIKHVPRWYLGYIRVFVWLFYHLFMFYHQNHIKLWSNRSWRSKLTYCSCDQNEIHMYQLWLSYEITHDPIWCLV